MKYFATLLLISSLGLQAQGIAKEAPGASKAPQGYVAQEVAAQDFTFKALTAQPSEDVNSILRSMYPNVNQNVIQLNGPNYYMIKVTPQKLEVFLPYFGRAYSSAPGSSEAGYKFTSTNYEYKTEEKKGVHEIRIRPLDHKDINNIFITIFSNGNAAVRIISNTRSAIVYQGILK